MGILKPHPLITARLEGVAYETMLEDCTARFFSLFVAISVSSPDSPSQEGGLGTRQLALQAARKRLLSTNRVALILQQLILAEVRGVACLISRR